MSPVIPSSPSSPNDAALVKEFQTIVARVAPQHLALATETLARMPPDRWQMEWYLPMWVGSAFGLDETRAREMVLSNTLGMVSIRLQDDLADGDITEREQASSAELAQILLRTALAIYQPYFPPSDPFWERVSSFMDSWRKATAAVNQFEWSDLRVLKKLETPPAQIISALGAPLKICVDAICSLTAHPFDRSLDHLLDDAFLAAVLHDHVIDCDADLRAGRWNLFAATLSPSPQSLASYQDHRARTNAAWMTSDAPRVYFEQIAFHLKRAQEQNKRYGIKGLDGYLTELRQTIWRTHDSLACQYRADLVCASEKLFGPIHVTKPLHGKKGGKTSPVRPTHSLAN